MIEDWKEKSVSITDAPQNTRIYAIGDIHGEIDLLKQIHQYIIEDLNSAAQRKIVMVYLGDYIDRGPASSQVVEYLLSDPLKIICPGLSKIFLKGNHEDFLLRFIDHKDIGTDWLANGGSATLKSYGIEATNWDEQLNLKAAQNEFVSILPEAHLEFFQSLQYYIELGGYLFVHAGIRPNIALEDQNPIDFVWIREPFLSSSVDHGKYVIHGHSIFIEPDLQSNRMGIDTGAYRSGCLTCAVFEDKTVRFLQT